MAIGLSVWARSKLVIKRILLILILVGCLVPCAETPGQQRFYAHESPQRKNAQQHPTQIPNNMVRSTGTNGGNSSKQQREQALRQIPMQRIAVEKQRQVADVLENASIYRRLPVSTISTDPDMYLFLVRYPETILNIWQIMGVTQMSADRTSAFHLLFNDGVGTDGHVELIYGTPTTNIYYGEGVYEGPMLFRRVNGQCVIVLETQYQRDALGHPQATSTLDVFLKIDHVAAGLVAKTVHPLVGSTADHNFVETLKFVEKLYLTSTENNHGVKGLSQRLTTIHPDVRDRFEEIVDVVGQRTATIRAQGPSEAGNNVRPTTFQQPGR
ncbi:MAG TPA: hypothetical protein PKD64_07400 [Pirellulaceae bacterium]|nr:hypothetical protein [Pirellulaceae bacterium]HMO92011.1 hypothetical protein [Pirellulaceae bacterium]HMP68810.1 hypothetical protein [Pirellulaceae bacterium]